MGNLRLKVSNSLSGGGSSLVGKNPLGSFQKKFKLAADNQTNLQSYFKTTSEGMKSLIASVEGLKKQTDLTAKKRGKFGLTLQPMAKKP